MGFAAPDGGWACGFNGPGQFVVQGSDAEPEDHPALLFTLERLRDEFDEGTFAEEPHVPISVIKQYLNHLGGLGRQFVRGSDVNQGAAVAHARLSRGFGGFVCATFESQLSAGGAEFVAKSGDGVLAPDDNILKSVPSQKGRDERLGANDSLDATIGAAIRAGRPGAEIFVLETAVEIQDAGVGLDYGFAHDLLGGGRVLSR